MPPRLRLQISEANNTLIEYQSIHARMHTICLRLEDLTILWIYACFIKGPSAAPFVPVAAFAP